MNRTDIADLILTRFDQDAAGIRDGFASSPSEDIPTHAVGIDDLLPEALARRLHQAFPPVDQMRFLHSFRERKSVSNEFDTLDPVLLECSMAFQDARVVNRISELTGIAGQLADPSFYAGGLSQMVRGHFLNPHIDNSHDGERRRYRTLNLLYYVTPEWDRARGGHLELWDSKVRKNQVIESRFNRLVLMETNETSWHSVSPVVGEGGRCCISNYYFSEKSPTGADYFQVTSFSGRPDQPVRRMICEVDRILRMTVRKVFPKGVAKDPRYNAADTPRS